MRLLLTLVAFLVVVSGSWVYFTSPPSRAAGGASTFLPFLVKEFWMEPVKIVERDGHQAVYWPAPSPPGPYYPFPTPTPSGSLVSTIPIYLEVENQTGRNIAGATVEFWAKVSSGAPITTTVAPTLLDVLRPGQRSPVAFSVPFPGGYQGFQAATKGFTVSPNWSYSDWDTQAGLEVRFSPPWGPSPSYPTPGPYVAPLPNVYGWVTNTSKTSAASVSVVVSIRGNEQASGLVLEATRVPVYYAIPPGGTANFNAYFPRDYGPLFGSVEAAAQRRVDIPGILAAPSW